jgi:hypothetical protein
MVHVWGGDGNKFAGRRMALYRDDKVTFGKEAVGGIRISHMSDIDRDVTIALTVTRANRRPYTVKPLPPERAEPTECVDLLTVLTEGRAAAQRGSVALTAWWGGLDRDEKAAAKPTLDSELKATATAADLADIDDTSTDFDADTPPDTASEMPASDASPSSDAGEPFPGDLPAGEAETASPTEPEVLIWQRRLIEDVDGLRLEQLDQLLANPSDQEMFAELERDQPQLAMDLKKAITRRRKEMDQ